MSLVRSATKTNYAASCDPGHDRSNRYSKLRFRRAGQLKCGTEPSTANVNADIRSRFGPVSKRCSVAKA
eukprot:8367928-Alexandrium_andersonii.AAC.1